MNELGLPVFDADNHYYEALDAFTRHLDPRLGPRCVQWAEIDGRQYHVVGGRVSQAVVNPTFDPDRQGRRDARLLPRQPRGPQPARVPRGRASRSAPSTATATRASPSLDEQGLEAVWLFPTLGMLYEELLKRRPRRGHPHVHRVQPLARRGLGLRLPGPHLRRALPLARRRRTGPCASSSGRSTTVRARS